jgi:dolichyl-phosphate-mannose--protein O-mannosyl transferase
MFGVKVAIFSSTVIAFENLNLVMSRITMNDVFVTFFIICSFNFAHLYLTKKRFRFLLFTSLVLGLAVSSKWTGFYAIILIFTYTTMDKLIKRKVDLKDLLLIVIPIVIYLASYGQFWLQGHTWKQFADLHKQIWWYQNKHDLEHPYGTTPLYCVPKGLNSPKTFCPWVLDIRPVYYSYEQYGTDKAGYIYALGNPFIFWAGFAAVCYLTFDAIKKRSLKLGFVLLGYFIFWVPWIFSPRIMFLSHYLPSIPFMAVLLGFFLGKLDKAGYKYVAFSILALFIFAFFYFYPITSGYPIEISKIDKFMWIESWR